MNDILDELGPLSEPVVINRKSPSGSKKTQSSEKTKPESLTVHAPKELNLNDQEQKVIQAIHLDPRPIDEVLREVDLDSSRILATLTVLEMKQLIKRFPGNFVARSPNY